MMRRSVLLAGAVLVAGLAACSGSPTPAAVSPAVTVSPTRAAPTPSTAPAAPPGPVKVMTIAMENETYQKVIGSRYAPYLTSLSKKYGTATRMSAGYPVGCPSLASYLIMNAGDRYDVCDDAGPDTHQIPGPNLFSQVAASGREWRNYAESMPGNCARENDLLKDFLVRHAPAVYFETEQKRCRAWMVPLGTLTKGALHRDVAAGDLPAYSFVTPNACNDMHGGAGCSGGLVSTGDAWVKAWLKQVMAGPDYRSGKLVVFVLWDEGDLKSNHVPMLAVGPTISHARLTRELTQCSVLRTVSEILDVKPLGCAAKAPDLRTDLGIVT